MPFPPNVARFLIITVFRDVFRVGLQLLQAAVFQTQKGTFCFLWGQTRSCYAGPQRKHFNGHLNDFSIRKSVRNDEKSLSFNFFTLHNFKSSTTLRWGRDTWRSSKLPQAICKRTQHCWATTPNIVGCYMLCPFANPVACCCVLLCKVWNRSNFKPSANGCDIVGRQVPTLLLGFVASVCT